ncbi:thioredoxin family protein [Faecalicatena sp. Marseille-Q4148]|nr:thioredoxin family protein [Faecalicatena sp. Marseille-Q4148]
MEIKVIGAGCKECDTLYANTLEAAKELKVSVTVEKVEDLMEIVRLGVMAAPSLMVDGKVIVKGQVLSTAKLVEKLKKCANEA